ncbi:MAG: hypothetical protein ABNH15_13605 [Alcanivorax sp.]|jgi:hypothetical protein|tara:strand:+ start:9198 stop:10109 length:912 start_codon:yes stop_codon:yes gene_type:complete
MLIRLLTVLLLSTFPSTYVLANAKKQQEQPQGDLPLAFESLTGSIILNNGSAPKAELTLTVSNAADDAYNGTVRFAGSEMMALEVPGNDSITLTLTPKVRHAGKIDQLQKAEVDLTLELDTFPAPPVDTVDIDIKIPPRAFPVVRAEPPIMEKSREDEFAYEYYALAQQLQPLKLTYNPGPINLQVRKTVYPIPVVTGPIEISIEVINHGDTAASQLTLRDSLEDQDFTASGESFTRFVSSDGVTELVWEAKIESLAPGESQRLKYTVNAKSDVGNKQLPATTVIMEDELTGLSNKVWLPKWH